MSSFHSASEEVNIFYPKWNPYFGVEIEDGEMGRKSRNGSKDGQLFPEMCSQREETEIDHRRR